jgi:AcrR family transcriptional regulator
LRSALVGGVPARQRVLGAQGRKTVRRLLEAGLAELAERGLHAFRVDDVVRRAQTSHGTFYLYFSNRQDLFRALMRDTLHDIKVLTRDFPAVTDDAAGRAALRDWVHRFADTYAAHAAVIRALSQAGSASEAGWGDGLRTLFGLAEAIAAGMTRAARDGEHGDGEHGDSQHGDSQHGDSQHGDSQHGVAQHAELTALACVMMLERVNYLISIGVTLPADEMTDRLSEVIYAAFHSAQPTGPRAPADPAACVIATC